MIQIACSQREDFGANILSELASGVAVLGGPLYYSVELEELLQAIEPDISQLSSNTAATLLTSLAVAGHWTPLLSSLDCYISSRRKSLNQGLVPGCLWSCAKLNFTPKRLLDAANSGLDPTRLSTGGLITCLWSLAVMDKMSHRLFSGLWKELSSRTDCSELSKSSLMMLHQVKLAAELMLKKTLPEIPIAAAAAAWWEASRLKPKKESSYQRDITRCLQSLGYLYVREDTSRGISFDVFLPDCGIAIEVDGPTHFLRNTRQPLGQTAFKRRLAKALGVKLLPISIEEWDSVADRKQKLRQEIEALIAQRP